MKKLIIIPIILIASFVFSQSLEGSWKLIEENGMPVTQREVIRIYQDNYFAEGAKNKDTNDFLWALGGEYNTDDYSATFDFNTKNPELVGETQNPKLIFESEGKITINNVTGVEVWERTSANQNDLSGNWVITGIKRNEELREMQPGARRTIKILGGDRFQWVAFNSETREFFGSGGGSYTAEDGKYIENIDFFSRDKERVGASLEFDFEVKDGEWHHSGKSSKGDPMYEIWSSYVQAYTKN
ncbi:hypothetical protein [Christiangramia sabulilitoris]|uniref:Membrane or secreted protein n=1 Tax=Christiangramia sabulilitoris TaxID=2583991 RepID=A0A550I8B7_9FLAO|nr:hypothetical protein [Christiangramia sabulilitoris]TRO67220.1 hypothetical protein FGM01_04875 [Christiangramia sabulilitoris]